eukprot:m.155877 g.155877  ORF g.155877 m.155877 type:complete len:121 (+) comp24669_c0_seq1:208-570(+)
MLVLENYIDHHKIRLVDLFTRFDKDGSGTITTEEFHRGVTDIGVQLSATEIESLLESIDQNNDGVVDYKVRHLVSLPTALSPSFFPSKTLLSCPSVYVFLFPCLIVCNKGISTRPPTTQD